MQNVWWALNAITISLKINVPLTINCTGNYLMLRINIFVDGSNLIGSLTKIGIEVEEYGKLFRHIFERAIDDLGGSFNRSPDILFQLTKTYWYGVGSIDNIDILHQKTEVALRKHFEDDRVTHNAYMAAAGKLNPAVNQDDINNIAWETLKKESSDWYQKKKGNVDGFNKFYYALQSDIDFFEIKACGHWKVDFINRTVDEKGVDTSFAVDMVTLVNNYDIALLVSGDADGIPSLNYIKSIGKPIGIIDFIHGSPPASKGKQTSTKLKLASDFVVQIYETDLIKYCIAKKRS
jgi:uncharacterized LabA/DUF88 family protein